MSGKERKRKTLPQPVSGRDVPLHLSRKGFSLIELSIVLVVIGLILGAAVTFWRSSIMGTKVSTTKTNLDNIKNSVINFAVANGRLPCPDTTVPPNNTGVSNPPGPGVCLGCANPPCYLPFQTLQLQLPGGKDSYGNVFRYDVSYEAVAGSGLTNTTQDTFCGVLFEYLSNAAQAGVPRAPCVTNQNDGADDGQIGAAGQGYGVAALAISETPVDNAFNAPPGLTGKNVAGSPREYEMASRINDNTYGNLVGELTYGDLYNKICNSQNTRLAVFAQGVGNFSVRIPSGGSCYAITNLVPTFLTLGQTMDYYVGCTDCSCAPPAATITFATLANIDWNGNRNGQVNANQTDH